MAEDKKDPASAESCARKCGGCKFLVGILAGLLLAGTGFGLYMAGRCGRHMCPVRNMCPFTAQPQPTK